MLILLVAHVATAAVAGASARRLGPRVFLLALVAPVATLVWLATKTSSVMDGGWVEETVDWQPRLGVELGLRLDGFSLVMVLLVAGIGVAVFAYSAWYFDRRPDLGRLSALLVLFAGSMLGVVLADNLIALYVFWELTSVTSFLLVGIDDHRPAARAAALQAILVTGAGGLAMLAGFVVLAQSAGTWSLSALLADPPSGSAAATGLVLVLAGAFTKSAQVPFHFWLPGAMAAPTPISAFLHSATMVKAGVYLIARLAPAFAAGVALWRPLVLGVGLASMLVGGWEALRRSDLKSLLAYGTVSQLGFLVVLVGAGVPAMTVAGVTLLVAHALFKATLFLVTGIVDHQAHTRDLRQLSGLGRRLPVLAGVAAIAAAAMAGIPLTFGFIAKESALDAALSLDIAGGPAVVAGIALGSVLTVAYSARFLWGAFGRKEDLAETDVAPPAPPILVPAAVLAVVTVVLGLVPALADSPIAAGADALWPGDPPEVHLAIWHGFTAALGLSVLIIAAGAALFGARAWVARLQGHRLLPHATDAYRECIRLLNVGADRVTGVMQNGSLPAYLTVILLCMVVLPVSRLVGGAPTPDSVVLGESALQVVVVVLVMAAAVATAALTRRFAAVLALGTVGYGVAVLFVIQGAPDLALTQLLIETLAVVIFLLVLRHLPERFEPVGWAVGRVMRITVAVVVGAIVSLLAVVAAASRTEAPISDEMAARALPDGGGRNIVNVILVDLRGYDTMGEITVLSVAALGIASLVLAGRRGATGGDTEAEAEDAP